MSTRLPSRRSRSGAWGSVATARWASGTRRRGTPPPTRFPTGSSPVSRPPCSRNGSRALTISPSCCCPVWPPWPRPRGAGGRRSGRSTATGWPHHGRIWRERGVAYSATTEVSWV
ncbi:hypothetical protein NKH18_38740 [Streptomyces sp. M10(2022)]